MNEENIECHLCLSKKNVLLCQLENCNYPMCKSCKNKAFESDNKCPSCRREIIIEINDEIENKSCIYIPENFKEKFKYIIKKFNLFNRGLLFCIKCVLILTILIFIGRIVAIVFHIGSRYFWFDDIQENLRISSFIGFSFIGVVLCFLLLCITSGCITGIFCNDEDDY